MIEKKPHATYFCPPDTQVRQTVLFFDMSENLFCFFELMEFSDIPYYYFTHGMSRCQEESVYFHDKRMSMSK